MNNKLTVSGERVMLGQSSERNVQDHVSRYEFATLFSKDKIVLDIACGTGYGTKMLSEGGAKSVYGVDISEESVAYAVENYSTSGTQFFAQSAEALSFEDSFFDTIVSFETIEHLEDDVRKKYLSELHRVSKNDGTIIFSTPNKLIASPWSDKPLNKYHVLEYMLPDLQRELQNAQFKITEVYGQRMIRFIFTKFFIRKFIRLIEKIFRKNFHIFDIADNSEVKKIPDSYEALYFVVVCKKI